MTVISAMLIRMRREQVLRQIERLQSRIAFLRRVRAVLGGWRNADSDAFMARVEQLIRDLQDMVEALEEYARVLEASARDYETTQERVIGAANDLISPRGR